MRKKLIEQNYELTFILDEKAGQEQGEAKTAELKKYIEAHGGKITKEDLWGRRELAYPIARNRSGFYVTLVFSFPPTEVLALERQLRFDESVIRSLVTKAYTTAQPGTLYPQQEEAAEAAAGKAGRGEEKASAEEMLRRTSGTTKKGDHVAIIEDEDELPEEERLKKLDETLEEMLKEEA